jgi:signal transduction histidine kinase
VERGLLTGLAVFRWAAWAWMALVLAVNRDDLRRPGLALLLVGLALAVTVWSTVLVRTAPALLLTPPPVVVEVLVGVALLVGDGAAYEPGHAFGGGTQSLGSAWPLAGVLSAGLAFGASGGAAAGLAMGLGRLGGVLANGGPALDAGRWLSIISTTFLYVLAGGAAGFSATRARRLEREAASIRAREEVARHLHDGVLQTLAVVQRRADDPALVALARTQERELRDFLLSGPRAQHGLEPGLRRVAARFEEAHGGRVDVVVAEDVPRLDPDALAALVGAVSEAMANAGRHGGAGRVTVYAEPADEGGVACSVKDDGTGFDPATATEGMGLTRSIRGRVAEVGGRVEVDSAPGWGTEVRLWVPS